MGRRLHYEVRDVNKIILPNGKYDFVIAKMALHHFARLENVFEQVRQALRPGGVLMFNDFIGPSRFQWTNLQLHLMNAMLAALPEKNRHSAYSGDVLRSIDRPTVRGMIQMDPTEAVRSAEIMATVQEFFEVVEYKPYGGTLLHILLTHVMDTFDLENEDQVALLRMMFLLERTLVQRQVLGSDFAYVVARPLSSPRRRSKLRKTLSRIKNRLRALAPR